MSITLNGVALSSSMLWTDRHAYSPVAQTVQPTLGGGIIVYSQSLTGAGQAVTLEALEDTGWITKAMLDQIKDMAAVAGAVYTLNFHGEVMSVMFRHDEAPAVDFKPLTPKSVPEQTDYYIGTLKLFKV